MLSCDKRLLEVPRLAARLMMQADIAPRDKFQLLWQALDLDGRPHRRLAEIGHVTILLRYCQPIPPCNLACRLFPRPHRIQNDRWQGVAGHSCDAELIRGL